MRSNATVYLYLCTFVSEGKRMYVYASVFNVSSSSLLLCSLLVVGLFVDF